jgi:membrane protein DedA with SNARE-associated domain
MPDILNYFSQYIGFYPLAAFLCLLLAGLNIPVSEDLVIITGSLVCQGNRHLIVPTLIGTWLGIIISDFMVFWIGNQIVKGALKHKFFNKALNPERLEKMRYYLDKYGIWTFIVCRFIPFGVRNTLFMASGILKLKPKRFACCDIPASIISMNTLFWLIFFLGQRIQSPFKTIGTVLFCLLLAFLAFLIGRTLYMRHKIKKSELSGSE